MHKQASFLTLLQLNAYWAGLSFMWNALHPIVLPALLVGFVPAARKNTYLGLLTFAGLLVAMILQPVSGAISDRWISKYGRRRPLILIGTCLDAVFLVLLASVGGLAWLIVGYVGLQVSSNIAQGPLQALLRDRVPHSQLGVGSSIKVFLDLASFVMASLVAARLMGTGPGGAGRVIVAILVWLLICAAITIIFAHEEPSHGALGDGAAAGKIEAASSPVRIGNYGWLIAERGAFLLGIYGLQAFGQYYLQDALRVPNPPQQAGYLLAAIGAGTIILVLAGGFLVDKFGAKPILIVASGLTALGMLLMPLTIDLRGLYVIGSLVGAGIGLFLSSNWALANQIAPRVEAGKFLGLTNLGTAGAAALSRLEGPGVDLLNAAQPGAWLGYKAIFVLGAVFILVSTWFLAKVR